MDGWRAIVYVCVYVCLMDNGGLVSGWGGGLVWDEMIGDEEKEGGCWCHEKGREGEGGYDVWCGCL